MLPNSACVPVPFSSHRAKSAGAAHEPGEVCEDQNQHSANRSVFRECCRLTGHKSPLTHPIFSTPSGHLRPGVHMHVHNACSSATVRLPNGTRAAVKFAFWSEETAHISQHVPSRCSAAALLCCLTSGLCITSRSCITSAIRAGCKRLDGDFE